MTFWKNMLVFVADKFTKRIQNFILNLSPLTLFADQVCGCSQVTIGS